MDHKFLQHRLDKGMDTQGHRSKSFAFRRLFRFLSVELIISKTLILYGPYHINPIRMAHIVWPISYHFMGHELWRI